MSNNVDKSIISSSAIIYSASLSRRLAANRFPPTYIGLVRRVRPSSHTVKCALQQTQLDGGTAAAVDKSNNAGSISLPRQPLVKYTVIDDETGLERRMTSFEKKQARLEAANLKKERKKQAKSNQRSTSCLKTELANNEKYFQLDVDHKLMADELTELKGLRDGVPPVALAPASARQAALQGLLPGYPVASKLNVVYDEELSRKWASLLKQNMASAEHVRASEDMRTMPYILNPEAWTRMQPKLAQPSTVNVSNPIGVAYEEKSWSLGQLQPISNDSIYNITANAVVQLLYQAETLEVSCGAKFGSDFLLYNASREECHAFAGLRIECSESANQLALLSAYDVSGFVRGLNTAAKLALVSTVVVDGDIHRVAIVDLALEKVVVLGKNKRAGPVLDKLQKKK
ncbi:hypothetical protein MPSEU_000489600 [Mayamaea pseudoterrestris]|nr:hypothetical protein MPSEU_000489600 [Mayamaea pseudoterrestris]